MLYEEIRSLRELLYEELQKKGLNHNKVLKISQELDEKIIQFYRVYYGENQVTENLCEQAGQI